ncbi:MAG: Lrp/AsnC ligand binding domain-containing protein [Candidatus Micrarchaeia archaeon]
MITAIVLIEAEVGAAIDVAEKVAALPEVREAYTVAGNYDVVAIVCVKEFEETSRVVVGKISNIPGVKKTTTLFAFECFSRYDVERMWGVGFEEKINQKTPSQ